jgi:hypothetical protein
MTWASTSATLSTGGSSFGVWVIVPLEIRNNESGLLTPPPINTTNTLDLLGSSFKDHEASFRLFLLLNGVKDGPSSGKKLFKIACWWGSVSFGFGLLPSCAALREFAPRTHPYHHHHHHNIFQYGTDQQAYCERLAESIKTVSDLPSACKNFDSVKAVLQKRKTVTDPFAGMKGATQARADRTRGQEHHAQIQRRLTTGGAGAEKK